MKEIPLLTSDYPPRLGGVAQYYKHLVEQWPDDSSVSFSPFVIPEKRHWTASIPHMRSIAKKFGTIALGEVLPHGIALLPWLRPHHALIVFFHGLDIVSACSTPRKKWILHRILKHARIVIVNSESTKALFKRLIPEYAGTVSVMYPLTNMEPIEIRSRPMKRFLFLGRLVPRKGPDTLVRIWKTVRKAMPDAVLTIAGNGPLYDACVAEATEGVYFIPNVSEAEKRTVYENHDAFIFTPRSSRSDHEGFGIVLLEAAVAGLGLCVSPIDGMHEAVYAPAIMALPHSEDDIAHALAEQVGERNADLEAHAELLRKQQRWVADNFTDPHGTWKDVIIRIESI